MKLENKIIILSSITMFVSLVDVNIVNIAYPFIAKSFNVGIVKISLISLSFLMMLTISIPLFGRLNDIIGIRKTFLIGYFIFTVSGILCGVSINLNMLILSRGLQGIGAGMLSISATASIVAYIIKEKRGKALGYMGMAGSLGLILGSPLGGFLTDYFGWKSIFLIVVPISSSIFIYAYFSIPKEKPIKIIEVLNNFNFKSAIYITIFTASLVFVMIKYIKTKQIITTDYILLGISILSLLNFIFNELKSKTPLLGINIFKDLSFTTYVISNMLIVIMLSITNFILPFLLSAKLSLSAKQIGLVIFAFSFTYGLSSAFTGKFVDKKPPELFCLSGVILILITNILFIYSLKTLTLIKIILILICLGISFAMFLIPITKLVLNKPTTKNAGSVTAIFRTTRQFASLLGIMLIGFVSNSSSNGINFYKIIKYEIIISIIAISILVILNIKRVKND